MNNKKKLSDVLPKVFLSNYYKNTIAYKLKDVFVEKEHCCMYENKEDYIPWPGNHKNVCFWVELENGYIVGWNENTNKEWTFPAIKRK